VSYICRYLCKIRFDTRMKKFALSFVKAFLAVLIFWGFESVSFAQEGERAYPVKGELKVMRHLESVDIEGEIYESVDFIVKNMKPSSSVSTGNNKVEVEIRQGKKSIYYNCFKNSYLYIYSTGQLQVGQPNFYLVIIYPEEGGKFTGIIRAETGVYQ